MKLSNTLRSVLIAVPVMTLMACTSGPSEEELAAERNRIAAEQAAAQKAAEEANAQRVQAEAAARLQRAEEVVKQEREALQAEQTVYFYFDRSTIRAEFYATLDKHAAFLVKHSDQSVVIQGHTDSRGTPEYNIALGERRAQAVETYLLNAGVSASQISVVSFGEEKPAVSGASEYAFAQNRRAVVVY